MTQNGWQKYNECVEISKIVKFEAPGIKKLIFIGVWIFEKLQRFVRKNVAGEQGFLTSAIFHTNPSNFSKIQAPIKIHSAMLGAPNFVTFIFLTCYFYFSHLFCTTTVFNDWQGHVTVSCKEPIEQIPCSRNYLKALFWSKLKKKKTAREVFMSPLIKTVCYETYAY